MNVHFFCTSPILAKNPILFLKIRTLPPKLDRTLKYNIFSTTVQVGCKKLPKSCEAPPDKSSVYEQADMEEFTQKKTLLGIDGNLSCQDLQKFPISVNDERKKFTEAERRRKIGLANEGRTPWNKGRKHTAETRRLIKERTIEALKDPKVRKKMSEWPHFFSEESKVRMSISMKKRWAERFKEKKVREEWYLMWSFSIAEAARIGGYDQSELGWNSYDDLKMNIHSRYVQWKEESGRRRELRKFRKLEAAERKAARLARLDQERWEKEERAKLIEMKKAKKSEDKIIASLNRLKKKAKSKLSKKLVVSAPLLEVDTSNETDPTKWDLEFVKKEKTRREISLAEQIQAVKMNQVPPHSEEQNDYIF